MANHSPEPNNYVGKKTFTQAMDGDKANKPGEADKAAEEAKREADKGEAAKNGGGKKK